MQDQDDKHAKENQATIEEQALSELYASLSEEQPPESMDEKIIVRAHDTLAADVVAAHSSFKRISFKRKDKRESTSSPFSGRWVIPASVAAVVVLSVSIITVIEQQRPYSLTSLPDSVPEQRQAPEPVDGQLKEDIQTKPLEKQVTPPPQMAKRAAKPVTPSLENNASKQAKSTTQNQALTRLDSSAAVAGAPVPEAPKPATSAQTQARALAADKSKHKDAKLEAMATIQSAESRAKVEPTQAGANKVMSTKDASTAVKQNELTQASEGQPSKKQSDADFLAKKEQHKTVTDQAENRKLPAQSQVELAKAPASSSSDVVSQEKSQPKQVTGTSSPAGKQPVTASAAEGIVATPPALVMPSETRIPKACYLLTIKDCLSATECTLHWNDEKKGYQCRKNANACEENFAQATGNAKACTSKPGCKYVPAKCFCPPDTKCDCAAGPAAMCMPIK